MGRSGNRTKHARERGATLFVVVLAITLLTGVGLYTVHSAALSERAAGNAREALQAHGVADLHAIAALSKFRREVESDIRVSADNANPDAPGAKYPCESNAGLTLLPCRSVPLENLVSPTGEPLVAADSFGPLGTLSGSARVDLTDVYSADIPSPGNSEGSGSPPPVKFYRGTVTVIGTLNPSGTGSTACVEDMMQVTGQHIIRSHLLFGPI
jgi:Tfp pilus assembly protein PilX